MASRHSHRCGFIGAGAILKRGDLVIGVFAVDATVMEANGSRYHGKAPDELDWTDAQRSALRL